MSEWDGVNRRRFPRVVYPCLVVFDNENQQEAVLTHTENIGIGGLCVLLKKNIKPFCPVSLEIDLLDFGDHIQCKGKVVWDVQCKNVEQKKSLLYEIGIEFVDLNKNVQDRIEELVKKLAKER